MNLNETHKKEIDFLVKHSDKNLPEILRMFADEELKKQLILTEVGCSFSIGFTQYIAKEHYKLVNIIGKTHYWMNEEFYKTTEQLLKDYKETLG